MVMILTFWTEECLHHVAFAGSDVVHVCARKSGVLRESFSCVAAGAVILCDCGAASPAGTSLLDGAPLEQLIALFRSYLLLLVCCTVTTRAVSCCCVAYRIVLERTGSV